MFEAMMGRIEDDFVRYIFHLEVVVDDAPQPGRATCSTRAAEDPVQGSSGVRGGRGRRAPIEELGVAEGAGAASAGAPRSRRRMEPVRVEKTPGRNEPCYCGSGKKFKLCHGR